MIYEQLMSQYEYIQTVAKSPILSIEDFWNKSKNTQVKPLFMNAPSRTHNDKFLAHHNEKLLFWRFESFPNNALWMRVCLKKLFATVHIDIYSVIDAFILHCLLDDQINHIISK